MYDKYMDKEVIPLCDALNSLPGIITLESCSGHGVDPVTIFFTATDVEGLFFLTRCKDRRYWQHGNDWEISLSVGDVFKNGIYPTTYILKSSKVGEEAYAQSLDLIANMVHHLNHENFKKYYNIDLSKYRVKLKKIDGSYSFVF